MANDRRSAEGTCFLGGASHEGFLLQSAIQMVDIDVFVLKIRRAPYLVLFVVTGHSS